jgi:hypothetical protein
MQFTTHPRPFVQATDVADLRAAIASVTRALATCSTEQVLELIRGRAALSRELQAMEEQRKASQEHVA